MNGRHHNSEHRRPREPRKEAGNHAPSPTANAVRRELKQSRDKRLDSILPAPSADWVSGYEDEKAARSTDRGVG